ncbi:electron transport complex subunit RsxD [Actinobacillus equuli]|uniref:electron transport complex subunit RsxD n=1 Tax=Actinobacillus equuli TaxID=718 RepID=UPI0024188150|nr:electron transport complex subunit RsxD [Actinobacillus equuli]MDG4952657.1 electron transport complex subunit RsxD [Actinobacillus equuli subsp. equuli]WGE47792.1 electron transport complex subunit RsxD [Actinobacillus equuli subsp. equuli]WGE58321.1 electron transport complex subunit RsxD [Actinobacillus equuli subsp. haemolyticus]WGE61087.1 electron transport complex subunit RsxD [Actinobacillus equuli subsp. haemolyticus]WGE78428.1 electron transport complex subunit RsxD [Actinobacillus
MFKMVSSPHTHSSNLTAKFMLWVMVAMLPALGVQWYFFGYGVFIQVVIAISLAVVIEIALAKLRRKLTAFYLADLSGLLTALILAMSIPPYAPYWIVVIGVIVALLLAKHVYGGLGQNLFNPAMVAYALLLVSFPVQMTGWLVPIDLLNEPPTFSDAISLVFSGVTSDGFSVHQLLGSVDGIAQATPLDSAKTSMQKLGVEGVLQSPIFSGMFANGWLQINLAFLAGGLLLIYKRIIHWQIPVAMLMVFALLSGLTDLLLPHTHLSVVSQLFSGAMMFGAFFIATDPVTASITPRGKLIFGGLIGLFVYLIRYYGNYPDAVAFSVLLANICVPLIDHYTQPRLYGTGR